jgi:hypothetical protein
MAGHTIAVLGSEKLVKGGCRGMAAEAQVGRALMGEHVPVVGAVDLVAGGAAFDAGGLVFVEERPALVGMAADARLVFEPGQPHPSRGFMLIVTRRAFHQPFLEPVALVQGKLSPDVLMTGQADLARVHYFAGRLHHLGVTGGAIQGRFAMGAGIEAAAGQGVALKTFLGFG